MFKQWSRCRSSLALIGCALFGASISTSAYAGATSGPDPHGKPCTPCCCPGGGAGGSSGSGDNGGSGSTGMPSYYVNPMLIGLVLQDTPLSYKPPKGPAIDFQITYNQKDTDQPSTFTYGNFGPKWTYNWIEYVQDNPSSAGSNVMLYMSDGQGRVYSGYNSSTGAFAMEPETGANLVLVSSNPITYERRMPDGSKEVFAGSDGSSSYPRKIFLTQRIDPQGNAVTLSYDSQNRLIGITDALGQTSTLQYGNANPLLVTGLTDPFGRSAVLSYDTSGRLASITDAIGMTSSFGYGSGTVISSMTTPYGTTQFAYGESGYHYWLNITDPNGHTSRWEFAHYATGIPFSESQVPAGMPTYNQYINDRNSFYWDAEAYARAPGDYTQAKIYHWQHLWSSGDTLTSDSLESIKYPLESRIWYFKPGSEYSGAATGYLNFPQDTGRVLADGSTQLTTRQYNSYGNVTDSQDAAGLHTVTTYASNDIDPIRIDYYGPMDYHTVEQFTYNAQHEPLTHEDENGSGSITTYAYNAAGQRTSITDPLGYVTHYNYDSNGYLTSVVDANGHAISYTYDNVGRMATETDPLGNTKTYSYDALNRITRITYWDGTYEENTWDKLDRVAHRDRNGNVTHYAYDSDRNLISITDPLGHVTSFTYYANNLLKSKTDPTAGVTTWTRDIEGRVTQRQDPNGGIWTFAYDSANRKISETNPLGQTTSFVTYDGDDRLTRSKDANGVITDLYYQPRGLSSERVIRANSDGTPSESDAITRLWYDAHDDLTSVVQPDNVTMDYGYDSAHRLTSITDADGDKIVYTLDPVGNRTAENTYDSNGTLTRSLTRSFDPRNQVQSQHDGEGDLTTFSYDANGNRVGQTDALGVMTHWSYDAEGRLLSSVQNYLGSDPATANTTTAYGYDTANHLVSVTDPDNLATGYQVDAMGRVTQLTSPDTGVTTYTYDVAGNRTGQTDARGVTSTYTYDALNRLTSISYPTSTLDVHYYYDEPDSATGCSSSYPIGHITRMTDSSGSTTWCYDNRGNVVSKSEVVAGTTGNTSYVYNAADRLTGLTYPDGASVNYTLDAEGRISAIGSTQSGSSIPLLSSITYLPFGPANSYSFVSAWAQTLAKTYDHAYRPTGVTGTVVASPSPLYLRFGLDGVGNPTSVKTDPSQTQPAETYRYDSLSRLVEVDDQAGTVWQNYTYDKTGDRITKTTAGQVPNQTYGYQTGTHRLINITGSDASSRAADANGNTTAIQVGADMYGLGYDNRNRLTLVQKNGSTVATYQLNGMGQRVSKTLTGASGLRLFAYDEFGHLLGEYGGGVANVEYVWAGDILVATLGAGKPHYVYTDGLGTPRAVTQKGGSIVWTWPYTQNPFGERAASGTYGFSFNPRFPGQYFDAETGLMYNGNRDYLAGDGRYIESDPIGLANGPSTYIYTFDAPLEFIDPSGTSAFGTGGFVGNYFGGGNPIDLSDVGLLGAFRTSQSVMSATSSFEAALESDIEAKAKSMCSGCSPSGQHSVSLSRNDKVVTDVTNEPGLFAVGHSTFFRSGSCTLSVDCQTRTYMLRCMFLFSIRDKFTDPLDGSRIGHPFDLPFSTPYPITATFSDSVNMEGGF